MVCGCGNLIITFFHLWAETFRWLKLYKWYMCDMWCSFAGCHFNDKVKWGDWISQAMLYILIKGTIRFLMVIVWHMQYRFLPMKKNASRQRMNFYQLYQMFSSTFLAGLMPGRIVWPVWSLKWFAYSRKTVKHIQ